MDDVYGPIRSAILTTHPLLTVKEAFSLFSREESHRLSHLGGSGVKGNNIAFVARPSGDSRVSSPSIVPRSGDNRRRLNNSNARNTNLVYKNSNMTSHTIKRCFELVGYPTNFKKRAVTSQNVTSNVPANVAGASQHITFTTQFLFDIIDVSHLSITVAHPNGTIEKVNQIGSCKITDKIVIHDVLIVPGYQDSLLKSQVGTSSQRGGLYFLDLGVDTADPYDPSEPNDDERGLNDSDGTNSPSVVLAEDTADAGSSFVDPSTSTSSKATSHPEPSIEQLGCITTEGGTNDDGATLYEDENISEGEGLDLYNLDLLFQNTNNDRTVDEQLEGQVVNYSNLSIENFSFVTNLNKTVEPKSYKEAVLDSKWIDAMNAEIKALNKNNTWTIIELPSGRRPIGCKWIWKIKYKSTGEVEWYKARLVAKGFDINNAFLYGDIEEDVYMTLLKGYFSPNEKRNDFSLYTKTSGQSFVIVLIYVDDILITGNDFSEIGKCKELLNSKFLIKDFGELKYFLGIEIIKNDSGICLSQRKYSVKLLSEYGMLACKPSKVHLYVTKNKAKTFQISVDDEEMLKNVIGYQKLVGKLIYLTITRPDISYDVHKLSQVMNAPRLVDMKNAFKVLRYIKHSPGKGIQYSKCTATRKELSCFLEK
ncbi:putative RNA-directed DNA polymerase [Tanacetum coccineum]